MSGPINKQLKVKKYYELVKWTAIPPWARDEMELPITQKELAEKLEVSEQSLINWKDDINFYEDVRRETLKWAHSLTPTVIMGLFKKASTGVGGDVAAFEAWMKHIENYREDDTKLPPGTTRRISGEAFFDEEGNIIRSTQTQELMNKKYGEEENSS